MPSHPRTNGLAERKHHHIVEIRLALLAHSAVPFSFWDMAFDTTNFLMNHMPTLVLNNVSPYKKLFAKSPDYSTLRSFGCACFHTFAHTTLEN